jgi:hypothetical protein
MDSLLNSSKFRTFQHTNSCSKAREPFLEKKNVQHQLIIKHGEDLDLKKI